METQSWYLLNNLGGDGFVQLRESSYPQMGESAFPIHRKKQFWKRKQKQLLFNDQYTIK